mgnify:CR=1 FL=1
MSTTMTRPAPEADTEGLWLHEGPETAPPGTAYLLLIAYDYYAYARLFRSRERAIEAMWEEIHCNVAKGDEDYDPNDLAAMADLAIEWNHDLHGISLTLVSCGEGETE